MKVNSQCEYNFGRRKEKRESEMKNNILIDMQQKVNSSYLCLHCQHCQQPPIHTQQRIICPKTIL